MTNPNQKGAAKRRAQIPQYGHPQFYTLLTQMAQLHSAKNHDYTDGRDPFLNFRRCEAMGIPAWKGAIVRMGDKLTRIENFATRNRLLVHTEAITDTLLDLAVYSLITLILYQEVSGDGKTGDGKTSR